MTYHNTTPIHGHSLMDAVQRAKHQDEAVLAFFDRGGVWSPSQVWGYGNRCGRQWLLTSVRRAISNLTKSGKLVCTGRAIPGPYGRPENTWSKV